VVSIIIKITKRPKKEKQKIIHFKTLIRKIIGYEKIACNPFIYQAPNATAHNLAILSNPNIIRSLKN